MATKQDDDGTTVVEAESSSSTVTNDVVPTLSTVDMNKRFYNYCVTEDDSSVVSVALKHHMDLNEFLSINGLGGFDTLFPGQILKVKNPFYQPTPTPVVVQITQEIFEPTPPSAPVVDDSVGDTSNGAREIVVDEDNGESEIAALVADLSPSSSSVTGTTPKKITALSIPPNIKSRSRSMSDTTSKYLLTGSNTNSDSPMSPNISPGTSPSSFSPPRSLNEALDRMVMNGHKRVKIHLKTPALFETEKGSVLSAEQRDHIHKSLPIRHYNKDWNLVYSSREHGISLNTLYRMVDTVEETILIVQTSKGQLFGGYASEKWRPTQRYYGTGETFVFTFNPVEVPEDEEEDDSDNDDEESSTSGLSTPIDVQIETTNDSTVSHQSKSLNHNRNNSEESASNYRFYRSTRVNDYFQTSTEKYLGFGGGALGPAMQIDSDLRFGVTNKCPTFNNALLCDTIDDRFSIYCVELWTFRSLI